jgi:hypothetical protein
MLAEVLLSLPFCSVVAAAAMADGVGAAEWELAFEH